MKIPLQLTSFFGTILIGVGVGTTLDIFQTMNRYHPLWYIQFAVMTLCIGIIMVVYVCDKYWKHKQPNSTGVKQ